MIRTKGEAGTGNVVEAVRHMRAVMGEIRKIQSMPADELMAEAKALGGYRVGVQSGTVHEQWIRSTLIDEGLMDEDNLFIYQQADHAVTDLGTGHLDLVLLDYEVADKFEQVGDFTVIAEGLNQQLMALAVPDGADELRTRINRVLIDMRGDGSLVDLVTEYFDLQEEEIPDLPPPGTEWPPPPDVTPPGCINGLAHVADLTYLVAYLFTGGVEPPCIDEGNVDGLIGPAGEIDVSDLTHLVAFLFTAGPPPAACP